jgi:hypothetical protein
MALSTLVDREGRNQPLFIDYYEYHSIATEDFSPMEDPCLSDEELGLYKANGFLVRPNADGSLYGVSLYHYKANGDSLTGLIPQRYLGSENQWVECRFIKILATNDGSYGSIATAINVGVTI